MRHQKPAHRSPGSRVCDRSPGRGPLALLRRLAAAAGATVLAVTLLSSAPADAAAADQRFPDTPDRYLVAADPSAAEVYVYRTSTMKLTGKLDDVVLGEHAGSVQLPDGRLLFTDDRHARVLAVRIDTSGHPIVVGSADIPTDTTRKRAG
ncbi:hypothetical protein ACWY4P_46280 [Streptomyces sp. LZ34]